VRDVQPAGPPLTLGVDLASLARKTAACVVDWAGPRASVRELLVGVDDDRLMELEAAVDATGIDCPFGWPVAFTSLLDRSPAATTLWGPDVRDTLRFRLTDARVRKTIGRWPLSVSSDLIAVPAMRCQLLLRRLGVVDRAGDGRVWEVYPAASLALWGFVSRGYKRRRGVATLEALVDTFLARVPWLAVDPLQRRLLAANDDTFDALIASLTARAAALGLTDRPAAHQREVAAREGWIALPLPGSLQQLAAPGGAAPC